MNNIVFMTRKTRVILGFFLSSILLVSFLPGCKNGGDTGDSSIPIPTVEALVPGDYPDPPAEERYASLPIQMDWNMGGGESWDYEFSVDGIIEEGKVDPSPGQEAAEPLAEWSYDIEGGRLVWFHGLAPGDVVVTFTTTSKPMEVDKKGNYIEGEERVVDIMQCAFRVFDDLTIALLHKERESFR